MLRAKRQAQLPRHDATPSVCTPAAIPAPLFASSTAHSSGPTYTAVFVADRPPLSQKCQPRARFEPDPTTFISFHHPLRAVKKMNRPSHPSRNRRLAGPRAVCARVDARAPPPLTDCNSPSYLSLVPRRPGPPGEPNRTPSQHHATDSCRRRRNTEATTALVVIAVRSRGLDARVPPCGGGW